MELLWARGKYNFWELESNVCLSWYGDVVETEGKEMLNRDF